MRELVFGAAVGSTWFFPFSAAGRLGATHLDLVAVFAVELAPRLTGGVGIPPLWITESSLSSWPDPR